MWQQLEAERQLRMSKLWRNAVNLPPLMLVAVIVSPLIIGKLDKSERQHNRSLARLRIVVEHVNRKLKIFRILDVSA